MVIRSRTPRKARIEIIPMIDVVFFLLVFFMMASLAMTLYEGMPVSLPQAASRDRMAAEAASVSVTREGQVFLNREPVTVPALAARLGPMLAKNRDLAVVINADREVTHARVVDVLDGLRQTGLIRIAIAVMPDGALGGTSAPAGIVAPAPMAPAPPDAPTPAVAPARPGAGSPARATR